MKKNPSEDQAAQGLEMLPEYDFRAGVRGKHHESYRKGHKVRIHRENGTIIEQHFTLEDGAVMLESDVKEYFPDSESVNKALRSLIVLIPRKRRTRSKPR